MTNEIDIDAWAPDPPQPERDELAVEHERAEQMAIASMVETPAAPAPAHPKPILASAVEQLRGMVFASRHGADPHIVTLTGVGAARDAACTCKAGTYNLPTGCFAMVFARTVWGLPAQGET